MRSVFGRLQSCRGLSRFSLLFGFGFYAVVVFFHDVVVWFGFVVAADTVSDCFHDALNATDTEVAVETNVPAVANAPATLASVHVPACAEIVPDVDT